MLAAAPSANGTGPSTGAGLIKAVHATPQGPARASRASPECSTVLYTAGAPAFRAFHLRGVTTCTFVLSCNALACQSRASGLWDSGITRMHHACVSQLGSV